MAGTFLFKSLVPSLNALADVGVQIAAGVPLQCDEPADFQTFRLGLFGLDKWEDPQAATHKLIDALDAARS